MKYIAKKFANNEAGNAVLDWAVFGAGLAAMAAVLVATVITL